jgi:hypothetical protein
VAAGTWGPASSTPQWRSACDPNCSTAVSTFPAARYVRLADFSLDLNGVGQPAGFGMDVTLCASNSIIQRVRVYGARHSGAGIAALGANSSDNRILNNIVNGAGLAVNQGTGGIFIQGNRVRVADNYIDGMCDDGYIANNTATDTVFTGNTYVGNAANTSGVAFHVEDASRVILSHNVCDGSMGGTVSCINLTPASTGVTSTDVSIIGNLLIGAGLGGSFGTASNNAGKRITIVSNVIRDTGSNPGIVFTGNVQGVTIQGNTIRNAGANGIEVISDTTTASQVIISGNYVDHCTTAGITVANQSAASPGQEIIITNNVSTDTSAAGSKVQLYGINVFPQNGPPTQYIIRNNDLTGNATAAISIAGGNAILTSSVITDNLGAGLAGGSGAILTAAATIAPTNKVHYVTGSGAISTITAPGFLYTGDRQYPGSQHGDSRQGDDLHLGRPE